MLAGSIPPPLRQPQQLLQPLLHMWVASRVPRQLHKLTHSRNPAADVELELLEGRRPDLTGQCMNVWSFTGVGHSG